MKMNSLSLTHKYSIILVLYVLHGTLIPSYGERQMMFDPETNEISFVKDSPSSCQGFPVDFDPKKKKIVYKPGPNRCKKMVMTMEKDYEIKMEKSVKEKVTYKIGF